MGNMKAVFLPLFINSVAIKFHRRDLCKVVEQDATGEGLGMWGEASSSPGLGVQPGGSLWCPAAWGQSQEAVLHGALNCLGYLLAGRAWAHCLAFLGLSFLICEMELVILPTAPD